MDQIRNNVEPHGFEIDEFTTVYYYSTDVYECLEVHERCTDSAKDTYKNYMVYCNGSYPMTAGLSDTYRTIALAFMSGFRNGDAQAVLEMKEAA